MALILSCSCASFTIILAFLASIIGNLDESWCTSLALANVFTTLCTPRNALVQLSCSKTISRGKLNPRSIKWLFGNSYTSKRSFCHDYFVLLSECINREIVVRKDSHLIVNLFKNGSLPKLGQVFIDLLCAQKIHLSF